MKEGIVVSYINIRQSEPETLQKIDFYIPETHSYF